MSDARRAAAEVVGLMYHEITEDPSGSGFQRRAARDYAVSPWAFAQHLEDIAGGALQPGLVTAVDPTRRGRHLLLTFDDGGKSALEAAEALASQNWKAHFFIVTSRIGDRTFLDAAGIRHLRQCGHLIGTHSHTHPDVFRDLSRAHMLGEWRRSTSILEQMLGEPCVCGSVPGGDISPATLDAAAESGLHYLFTSEPWLRPRRVAGCWVLGRMCVKAATSRQRVQGIVRLEGWGRARLERWLKEVARRGMGSVYRAYVRHSTRAWS
ncbi:MAG TPA: polysaccharide deacetylase family protein [Gemmatimonadales bacterium]|nr:polysaccharide deacetylase family protein [Gemmatimonadales bacterium]